MYSEHMVRCKEEKEERGQTVTIFPNFEEKQHGIHVVVTFVLHCCFWGHLDNAGSGDTTDHFKHNGTEIP